jgi:hypothetical protein
MVGSFMLFSAIANAVGAPLGGMLLDLDGLLGSTRVGPPNRARKRRSLSDLRWSVLLRDEAAKVAY